MLQPEHGGPATPQAQPRRLRRSSQHRIGGVAEGLGRYLQVPPVLIRVAFFVAMLLGGAGIALYAGAWLLIPGEDHADPRPLALTSNTQALVAGFLALLIGAFSLSNNEAWGLGAEIVIPATIVLAGFWILNQRSGSASLPAPPAPTRGRGAWPPPQPHPPAAAQPFAAPVPASPEQSSPWDKPAGEKPAWDDEAWENAAWENTAWESTAWENTALENTAPVGDPPAAHAMAANAMADPGWSAGQRAEPWAMPRTDAAPVFNKPGGPPVTSITLAAAAAVTGFFLVLANVAGIAISAGVILGAILAVIGAGLVASAVLGRALGLYPLALLVLVLLAGSPLIDATVAGGVGAREVRITSIDAVQPSYAAGLGNLTLDLSGLELVDDTTIEVDVGAGYAEIIVPPDVRVNVDASSRAGYVEAFNVGDEGLFNHLFHVSDPAARSSPTLSIEADVTFGYIEVRRGR